MLGFSPLSSAPLADDGQTTVQQSGETHVGAAALTASGSIAAVGTRVQTASAALTTQGSAVYASTASFRGAASLTASNSITAAAEVYTFVSASIDLDFDRRAPHFLFKISPKTDNESV